MKVIHRIGCCILTALFISCSSEQQDSSSMEIDVLVLDKVSRKNYSTEIIQSNVPASEEVLNYIYDATGRLMTINLVRLTNIALEGASKENLKVMFFYNLKNKLTSSKMINVQTEEELMSKTFAYNDKGLIHKVVDQKNAIVYTYRYCVSNCVLIVDVEDKNQDFSIILQYSLSKNIARVSNSNFPKEGIKFTYDSNKTPYTNMNLDFLYEEYNYIKVLTPFKFINNNIASWASEEQNDKEVKWSIVYEYNTEGMPTKKTVFDANDKAKILSIQDFSYKTIRIKAKNLVPYYNGDF
ncbi:hypothetical protein [Myroides odoratus]|uniref:hypothetical protein n=1 Tax=Myroides odoratus TaxID=256 RepID=UPI0039AED59D